MLPDSDEVEEVLTSGFLDLGKGLAEVLHPLHAGGTGLILVLQIPLLLPYAYLLVVLLTVAVLVTAEGYQ